MFSSITLNGISSKTIDGLIISDLPPITKPEMRVNIEDIDGRDGDIVTDLGYAAYDKVFNIGITDKKVVDKVIGFLNSQGTVTFSNEPSMVYNYKIIKQIDFNKLIRFKTAAVTMHVQPFKFCLTEKELEFSGAEQKISLIDYEVQKNGITVDSADGKIIFSGTASEKTFFYIPIDDLKLSTGDYQLDVFTSGTGASGAKFTLVNDTLTFGYCFGEEPSNLQDNKTISTTAFFSTLTPFNYIYVVFQKGQAVDFEVYVKLYRKADNIISIINKGNVYSLPTLKIFGIGDLTLGVNGEDVFTINLGLEGYISIDTTNLEAFKDAVLKNRLVSGNYDEFRLKPGVNTVDLGGAVEKITIQNYSRWL